MKEIKLLSGAVLNIGSTPFAESKALHQAILLDAKSIKINGSSDVSEILKNLMCSLISSKEIDQALSACLKRCTYNGLKIDDSTFESLDARKDYTSVWTEVVEYNISPFLNGLSVALKRLSQMFASSQT